jgi:hypothetical protein
MIALTGIIITIIWRVVKIFFPFNKEEENAEAYGACRSELSQEVPAQKLANDLISCPSTTDTSGEVIETPKPHETTGKVKPHETADAVKPHETTDEVKPHETTGEVASMLKQHEVVVLGEQKGIAYCFDSPETDEEETLLVIQVRHCRCGSPLLPTYTPDGILTWVVSDDPYLHFAKYLVMTLEVLTGKSWSTRIFPNLHNVVLARYQAAVDQEDWREIWDTLLKPFGEQRTVYRRINRVSRGTAPDIFFGVEAKPAEDSPLDSPSPDIDSDDRTDDKRCEPHSTAISRVTAVDSDTLSPATSAPSDRTRTSSKERVPERIGTESGGTESNDGFRLPRASEWIEFWQNTEIPQQRTFVDFAQHVNASEFLRRARSAPQLPIGRFVLDKKAGFARG